MAKASKKKRSDEFPPLRMVIEKGRLVPAFPYDAERLDTWRNGAGMLVWMASDGDRPLVRRWWATIGNYLKHTSLPFGDKETASAAIKLALAMVEPFKMPNGEWKQYPRSLTLIDDEDLLANIREMEQLLYLWTGVDVGTLRREAGANFGDEQFETHQPAADNDAGPAESVPSSPSDSATLPPDNSSQAPSGDSLGNGAEGQSSGADPSPASPGAAASNSSDEEDQAAGESELAAQPAAAELSDDDRNWLKIGARMLLACQPDRSQEARMVLSAQVKAIQSTTPKNIGADVRQRLEVIRLHCVAVCRGEIELDVGLVAKTALSTVAQITPAEVKTARSA